MVGECPTPPPRASPLVAERAFSGSDYWGLTRGEGRAGKKMTGICNMTTHTPSIEGVHLHRAPQKNTVRHVPLDSPPSLLAH